MALGNKGSQSISPVPSPGSLPSFLTIPSLALSLPFHLPSFPPIPILPYPPFPLFLSHSSRSLSLLHPLSPLPSSVLSPNSVPSLLTHFFTIPPAHSRFLTLSLPFHLLSFLPIPFLPYSTSRPFPIHPSCSLSLPYPLSLPSYLRSFLKTPFLPYSPSHPFTSHPSRTHSLSHPLTPFYRLRSFLTHPLTLFLPIPPAYSLWHLSPHFHLTSLLPSLFFVACLQEHLLSIPPAHSLSCLLSRLPYPDLSSHSDPFLIALSPFSFPTILLTLSRTPSLPSNLPSLLPTPFLPYSPSSLLPLIPPTRSLSHPLSPHIPSFLSTLFLHYSLSHP